METPKEKQQPFHVKRARMKDSVIKCKEILNQYSLLRKEIKKEQYDDIVSSREKVEMSKIPNQIGGKITEYDLLNNRTGNFSICQVKDMIRMYQFRRSKDAAHQMLDNGIAVKKINHQYTSSRNVRARTEYQQRGAKTQGIAIYEKKNNQTLKNIQMMSLEKKKKNLHRLQVEPANLPLTISHQLISKGRYISKRKILAQTTNLEPTISSLTLNELVEEKKLPSNQIPIRVPQKQYLYEKMANITLDDKKKFSPVYQRRIRSYMEFLWKILLSHNISLSLQLRNAHPFQQKHKAFIGPGNNCNMIKGLIKRRFWWAISEENTSNCVFIWTQIKNNKIFRRQESAPFNAVQELKINEEKEGEKHKNHQLRHLKLKKYKALQEQYQIHTKIWSQSDCELFQDYFIQNGLVHLKDEQGQMSNPDINFQVHTKDISNRIKALTHIQQFSALSLQTDLNATNYYRVKPLVHNHLQNNFNLGNKKALFHNLKYYYSKIGKDPFEVIPLTFHIKHGFRDLEYQRFVKFYQRRKEKMKQSEDQNGITKQRNIWIVKPGQNSNRGRGITVIDQIYQLDNIMKKSQKKRNQKNEDFSDCSKTFIVQMYIDKPMLYNQRKFDIRHYMLITNLYGVTRAYWYEEGYIRTSSYFFDVDNFEPEIHLTNDAIQKKYVEYGRYEPGNKISYSEFQTYLTASFPEKRYDFKKDIIPKMKEMATEAAKSVYLKMSPKNQMHNFQIFGLDFMIDRHFKPWLIEINTNPCLQCSCPLLNRIIPYMVEQSLKLSLDLVYPPPSHYPNSTKHYAPYISLETFKYELIFDSLTEGEALLNLFGENQKDISNQVGDIDDDEFFKDDGTEIKLQDYT